MDRNDIILGTDADLFLWPWDVDEIWDLLSSLELAPLHNNLKWLAKITFIFDEKATIRGRYIGQFKPFRPTQVEMKQFNFSGLCNILNKWTRPIDLLIKKKLRDNAIAEVAQGQLSPDVESWIRDVFTLLVNDSEQIKFPDHLPGVNLSPYMERVTRGGALVGGLSDRIMREEFLSQAYFGGFFCYLGWMRAEIIINLAKLFNKGPRKIYRGDPDWSDIFNNTLKRTLLHEYGHHYVESMIARRKMIWDWMGGADIPDYYVLRGVEDKGFSYFHFLRSRNSRELAASDLSYLFRGSLTFKYPPSDVPPPEPGLKNYFIELAQARSQAAALTP